LVFTVESSGNELVISTFSATPALNIPLLERLKRAPGQYLALADLGDDRTRVRQDLEALEQFGFRIERHPILGASYAGPAERLCPDQIEYGLGTRLIGRRIAVWNRVGSTNDLAARAGTNPANDGLVVFAEEQFSGRGQRGRRWSAPPRTSILMSVLVFPPPRLSSSHSDPSSGCAWLTALAAVATAELVSDWTGARARIKWPNDVRVDGRKIAGILVERALPPSSNPCPRGDDVPRVRGVVIGIGLNVNLDLDVFPPDLRERVTSLSRIAGLQEIDRSQIANDIIIKLDELYCMILSNGLRHMSDLWRGHSEHLDRIVRVATCDGCLGGRLVDLDLERGAAIELAVPGSQGMETRTLPLGRILSIEE
jgi:BirA family biotin operon repressor/biotin-[acetyl-CoA-carboxylase] ligase